MQVTRLQFGVYSNQQPFCLYLFPLVATSLDTNSSTPTQPIYQPFYRLRDIDAIFFNDNAGYIYDSGNIPQVYFDTPGYCFYERSGDVYLSSRALNETALRMGNKSLAEFCKLSRDEIRAGAADQSLKKAKVPIIKSLYVEAEFEFVAIDSRTWTSMREHEHATQQQQLPPPPPPSNTNTDHPINNRKRSQGGRMSIADVLDNDDTNDKYETRITSPTNRIEFNAAPIVKQEPSPANSTPSSPDQTLRSPRLSSPVSAFDTSVMDDDNSRRKRRRVIPSAITKTTNNPEVMEHVRNNIKLKQQKSVGEVRQNRLMQESIVDRRHSVAVAGYNAHSNSNFSAAWDPNRHLLTKRHSLSQHRVNRNPKNLSLYSPARVNRTMSASGSSDNNNSPIHTSMTAGHRASVSGYPSQSAFSSACRQSNQSQTVHPASRSASIHGLISSDGHNATRPVPSIQVTPSTTSHAPSPTLPHREPSTDNSPASSSNRSKDSFMQVFDTFYDAVADTHSLKTTLEEQIRKTSALLQTLQSSGLMIESLVRGQVREMQREVVNDLTSIEKRVARVEERMNCVTSSPPLNCVTSSPPLNCVTSSPPLDCDRRLSDISTVSSDSGYSGSSKTMSPRTPEAFSGRESQDVQKKDYENVLTQLKARLESLERRMSVA